MKKIVVVEDETSLLKALTEKLTHAGYQVFQAEDGELALNMVFENQPDLVLLDIILPKLDGIAVLERLQSDDRSRHIPVIILTNLDNGEKAEEAKLRGAHDFLVKIDWTLDQLLEKVRGIIGEDHNG